MSAAKPTGLRVALDTNVYSSTTPRATFERVSRCRGAQLVPPPPEVGIVGQQLKVLDQQIDEPIRRSLTVLGDTGPDQQDIAANPGR